MGQRGFLAMNTKEDPSGDSGGGVHGRGGGRRGGGGGARLWWSCRGRGLVSQSLHFFGAIFGGGGPEKGSAVKRPVSSLKEEVTQRR